MWFQKSREECICSGDRNTKFYHASTIARRSRNKIEGLFDDNNDWVEDSDSLYNLVHDFYLKLFESDESCDPDLALKGYFPQPQYAFVHGPFTKDDIKSTVYDIEPWKSPCPDGINLSHNGPAISHLLFADDMVLFAEASLDQMQIVVNYLDVFCKSSD